MKQLLTRSSSAALVFIPDPDTGARTSKLITIRANDVWMLCTNQARHKIPRAMADRFMIMVYDLPNTLAKDHVAQMYHVDGHGADVRRKDHVFRCRRDQFILAMYAQMIEAHVVKEPDLSIPAALFTRVLDIAHRAGSGVRGVHNPRNFQRMLNICRIVVIVNATHLYFDSDLSPCRGHRFCMAHVAAMEPLMVGKIEHAVFVLTLMQSMYGEHLIFRILDALIKAKFGGKRRFTPVRRETPLPRPQMLLGQCAGKDSKYNMYDHDLDYTAFRLFGKSPDGNPNAFNMFIDKLTDLPCLKNMNPQPSRSNIKATLISLTMVRNGVPSVLDKRRAIPVLKRVGTDVYLSMKTLINLKENHMLAFMEEALKYKGARPDTYVTGLSHTGMESNLRTLKITAEDVKGQKPAYVRNSTYVEPSLVSIIAKADAIMDPTDSDWKHDAVEARAATDCRNVLFSNAPRYAVNGAWEEYQQIKHMRGWSAKRLAKWYTNPRYGTVMSVHRDVNRDRMIALYKNKDGTPTSRGLKSPLRAYKLFTANRLLNAKRNIDRKLGQSMFAELKHDIDSGLIDTNLPSVKRVFSMREAASAPVRRNRSTRDKKRTRFRSSSSSSSSLSLSSSSSSSSLSSRVPPPCGPTSPKRFVFTYTPHSSSPSKSKSRPKSKSNAVSQLTRLMGTLRTQYQHTNTR